MQPGHHGMLGNQIFIPAVDPVKAFSNDNFIPLLKLDEVTSGQVLLTPSMAEFTAETGHRFVGVSSGSTGSALLLAPRAPRGSGTIINGDFYPGVSVGWPAEVSNEVLKRFGPQPKKGGAKTNYNTAVDWSMQVLRDYVLPELKPSVAYVWLTEPDHIQHAFGAGAPEALATIRNDDRHLGLVLESLDKLGLRERTNIMIISDHGFSQTVYGVNVSQALLAGGFNANDFVIASSGQTVALHVKDRDPARIRTLVEFIQKQTWTGAVFTAKGAGAAHEGGIAGTFALEFVHLGGNQRSPDIVFTFPWTSTRNRHGVQGTDYVMLTGGTTGPMDTAASGHGSMSPWTVKNTMLAWGPDFKSAVHVRTPSANVDVTPTILHLLGHPKAAALDGRILKEALVNGPDEEQVPIETRTLRVSTGTYKAALQVTETGGKRYLDKSWRE
ncbi:MAG TPA: alkaline phosphatase family protein [Burkholderiales bacterium]|nr:alkaline phosphatase family protein [Burkholderiales bacterium]